MITQNFSHDHTFVKLNDCGKHRRRREGSCLNEALELIQPHQVLFTVLVDHVLMQEIGCARFDSSDFQIPMERLLQILIQVPAHDNKTQQVQSYNTLPQQQTKSNFFKELQKEERTGSLVPRTRFDPRYDQDS